MGIPRFSPARLAADELDVPRSSFTKKYIGIGVLLIAGAAHSLIIVGWVITGVGIWRYGAQNRARLLYSVPSPTGQAPS